MDKLATLIFFCLYAAFFGFLTDYVIVRLGEDFHWFWDVLIGIFLSPVVATAAFILWLFPI